MFVINKRRISVIVFSLLIGIFAYSYQLSKVNMNNNDNTVETTATPVSGKVVVVDARASVSQMKGQKVVLEQQKRKLI